MAVRKLKNWEGVSKAPRSIEQEHAKIHDGDAYAFSDVNSLTSGAVGAYAITVPSSVFAHYRLVRLGASGTPFAYEVYEAPFLNIAQSGGVELSYMNMNRNSTKVTSVQVYKDPFTDVNSLGTNLEKEKFVAGGVQGGSAGVPTPFEWLLKQGENYLVRVINDDATTESYDMTTFLYESGTG